LRRVSFPPPPLREYASFKGVLYKVPLAFRFFHPLTPKGYDFFFPFAFGIYSAVLVVFSPPFQRAFFWSAGTASSFWSFNPSNPLLVFYGCGSFFFFPIVALPECFFFFSELFFLGCGLIVTCLHLTGYSGLTLAFSFSGPFKFSAFLVVLLDPFPCSFFRTVTSANLDAQHLASLHGP